MKDMFIEAQSRYGFDQTVEKLTEEIEKASWKILATHNLQQSLKNFDYEVESVKVIELCNPHYAQRLLSVDDLRIYSNLMPCRISVYDKKDGKTYISLMNAGALSTQASGTVQEVMSEVYTESLKIARAVIQK